MSGGDGTSMLFRVPEAWSILLTFKKLMIGKLGRPCAFRVIRAVLALSRPLPVYPTNGHSQGALACLKGAITGSQDFSITSPVHSSLPKHLGSISKRPARFSSSHSMAPIAFLGACFWVDGQKQT